MVVNVPALDVSVICILWNASDSMLSKARTWPSYNSGFLSIIFVDSVWLPLVPAENNAIISLLLVSSTGVFH